MDSIETHPMPLDVPRDRRARKTAGAPKLRRDKHRHFQRWTDTMPASDVLETVALAPQRPERRMLRRTLAVGFFALALYAVLRYLRR